MPRPSDRLSALRQALADDPSRAVRLLALLLAGALLTGSLLFVLDPMLSDFSTYGFHDWDVETAYRYITVVSLRQGEGPWWHPWLCGGVPGFGYAEVASNLVSPYLPLYLFADVRTAIRFEVLGQGLFGLIGTFVFAGLFTRSIALRSLLAALFVLNGRWALQAAVGHTWHLQYAFMPWAFYWFERSLEPGRRRLSLLSGGALAVCCYFGGVYPLPHTALLLSLYAALRALFEQRLAPLVSLALTGASAAGLAAPKLLAVADQMRVIPRLIESTEVIGPSQVLAMLTAPDQRYGVRSAPVPAYNWHEWGIYVGVGGLLVLVAGALFARGVRGHGYQILGLLCLLLGCGAFHPAAPWALLHRLPVFASQHVPSRFLFPMLLLLGAAFLSFAASVVDERLERQPWLELALLVPVAVLCWDMARFSQTPFEQAFWMTPPRTIPRRALFEQHLDPPVHYVRRDWAQPILLAMFANSGVLQCYGVDPNFEPGAIPAEAPDYRGLVFVEGGGSARVTEWSPSHAVVEVRAAGANARLVYDMNFDESWSANGVPATEVRGLVGAPLAPGDQRVVLRYFPRTFRWSVPIALLTLLLCLWPRSRLGALSALAQRLRSRISDRKPVP